MTSRSYTSRFVHPDDVWIVAREIGNAVATADSQYTGSVDHRVVFGDGTTGYMAVHFRIEKDAQGRTIRTRGANLDITERKNAENELKNREFWLMESQRVGRIGSFELDMTTGKWTSSKVLDEILGISGMPEKNFETWYTLVHPDQQQEMKEYFYREVIEMRHRFNKEYKIIRPANGAVRWVWGLAELTADPAGAPTRVIGTIQDITEKKLAEESLRESEERLRAFFESPVIGTMIGDVAGRVIDANDEFLRIIGYPREELRAGHIHWTEITPPELRLRDSIGIKEAEKFGSCAPYEKQFTRKDGSRVWVLIGFVLVGQGGNEMMAFVLDLSQSKSAEARLLQLSVAVEQSPASVVITDTSGNIEYVNSKFTQITGYTLDEVRGNNPRILKSGQTSLGEYKDLWETITSGREWRGELSNKKKNGEIFWESASISPILNKEGTITHFLAVKEDITRQRSLEEKLRQTQKMESIGTLAGGIAHDFNNILGIIIGHAGLLEYIVKDPERFTSSVRSIETAVKRGAGLVRQILTFARKTEIKFELLRLNDIIKELSAMLEETFPKTITFVLDLAKQLPFIDGDPTQLHQTFLNLCVNARDAMPDGGAITISTRSVTQKFLQERFQDVPASEYIAVSVGDKGTGMTDETRQRIFEPFFTTKEEGKGTGLGLSVVYGIIRSHHGFIDVDSTAGQGTTFHLYFPVPGDRSLKIEEAPQRAMDAPQGKEKILIVEDEVLLRNLVEDALRSKGYDVVCAGNGVDALDAYRRGSGTIALVLTDMGLPKLSGMEVLKQIRAMDTGVKLIAASGYLDPAAREELSAVGVVEFIPKPYMTVDLLRIIRNALDGRTDGPELPRVPGGD